MPQSPTEIPLVQPIGNENKPSVSVGYQYTYKGMVYTVSSTENEQTVICSSFDNKKASKVVIPATVNIEGTVYKVTAIADNAYKGCSKLKKITIGKNVVKIGKNAFAGCSKLKNIIIKSKALKKVGKKALLGVNSRALIKVPKNKYSEYKKMFEKSGISRNIKIKKK